MQESRRRRWLELCLLSVAGLLLAACAQGERAPGAAAAKAPRGDHPEPVDPNAERERDSPAPEADQRSSAQTAVTPKVDELPKGTLVLHVGDSFAGALGIPLGRRFKAAGLRSVLEYKTASYVPTWAYGKELTKFVSKYNPDLVLITLGANELDIPDPRQRVRAIERLVSTLGGRPCVWISPPRWKEDTGLLDLIRSHAAPCRFLDSDLLVEELPRAPDRIHPSSEGREIWAEAVFSWLVRARVGSAERPWSLRTEASRN